MKPKEFWLSRESMDLVAWPQWHETNNVKMIRWYPDDKYQALEKKLTVAVDLLKESSGSLRYCDCHIDVADKIETWVKELEE